MNISTLLLVFAGGAAGSVLRWWVGIALGPSLPGTVSPGHLCHQRERRVLDWRPFHALQHRVASTARERLGRADIDRVSGWLHHIQQLPDGNGHSLQRAGIQNGLLLLVRFGRRGARRRGTRRLGGQAYGIRHHNESGVTRYSGGWLRRSPPRTSHARSGRAARRFPDAIFIANVVACFFIGVISALTIEGGGSAVGPNCFWPRE